MNYVVENDIKLKFSYNVYAIVNKLTLTFKFYYLLNYGCRVIKILKLNFHYILINQR